MREVIIKPLERSRLGTLAGLFEMQMAEHNVTRSPAELVAGLTSVLAAPEQGFVLAAEAGPEAVGVAYAARILSLEHGGWSGWLEELYVLPAWRGKGVGSALLAAALTGASERGWAALDLEVDANHQRVIPLYARHQFVPVNRTRFVRRLK